ncbi:M91 family zinc metallopeptidase [Pseudomonas sp. LS1212]|uniref:M91 family zinc metallopeptidase n=1 Tax=Pseudomonas sp. LS1212 TaxID=2972478 RepID=UPI00215CA5DD|nr:M91 family zinc metallopeptidase [Pseudomonas sp. LS1212]UVJ45363.1 M91 family zinc metallopeptidase [Pseudomonas sp. LS1212]
MINPGIIKVSSTQQPRAADHPLPYRDARLQIGRQSGSLSIITMGNGDHLQIHGSASGILMQMGQHIYEFTLLPDEVLAISTGAGNDTVRIESALSNPVIVDTGPGDDTINIESTPSTVLSGPGNDSLRLTHGSTWVDTGPGNDRILATGQQRAIIHGGSGDDFIYSAAEQNFLQAGEGDDTLIIGAGHGDVEAVSGENLIIAGPGKDVFFLDTDKSQVIGANEDDNVDSNQLPPARAAFVSPPVVVKHLPQLHVLQGNDVGTRALSIQGSDTFKTHVEDILRLLRTTATAYPLLKSLDDSGAKILIKESGITDNVHFIPERSEGDPHIRDGKHGTPTKAAVILYNPLAERPNLPPVVIMHHELCHAWNHVNGTVLQNHENQVIGLPTGEPPFDFDNDPLTPPTDTNPAPFSENALRQELGLPLRLSYT